MIFFKLVIVCEGIILSNNKLLLETILQQWICTQQVVEFLGCICQMCKRNRKQIKIMFLAD